MRAPGWGPGGGAETSERLAARDPTSALSPSRAPDETIVPLRRLCRGCAIPFLPVRPAHRLCRRCYAWLAAYRAHARMRRWLAEAGR